MALMIGGLGGCSILGSALNPPEVVSNVDLAKYVGTWYEIARYPTSFQSDCVNSTAEYTAKDDGTVGVVNTCLGADGSVISTIEGSARIPDPATSAKLVVTFPSVPVPAGYWVVDLDPEYKYAVVSGPFRLTLFILSRTPTLEPSTLEGILGRLVDQGYDPAKLIYDKPVIVP